jgi:predicted RNase H-like nuclease (RuvC/YqgF family)
MLWLRLAVAGVILAIIAGVIFKVTSYLHEKDRMVQDRDQQILDLRTKVEGMRLDNDRLKQSVSSLEMDVARKREELAQAQREAQRLSFTDQASNKRLADLERKLNDQERMAKIERLKTSRHAELVLKTVNTSAKCEIENFFRTGGQCKNGKWVLEGERLVPKIEKAADADSQGESNEPQ